MKLFFFLSTSATLLLSTQSLAKPINEDHIFKRGTSSITTDGASLNGMEFNCVIVGGGTAGLAAAYQLAKDPNRKVLVIEAGGDTRNNDKVSKQSAYTQAFGDKQLDWNSATVPQQTAGGAVRRLHAGKGLGGTSTINGGAFSVPPSTQIDAFKKLGNDGWGWSTFTQFLKGFQNYHAPTPDQQSYGITFDQSAHGVNGPVDLGYSTLTQKDQQELAFVASIKQMLGVSQANDVGSGKVDGAAYIPNFIKPGQVTDDVKVTAATAFYSSIESSSPNLIVLLNTRATKILWQQGSSPAVASGVEYQKQKDGPTYSIKAHHVIVAAGTLRSPKLLELSGVGDKKVLDRIGVQTVINLPGVGANLIEQQKNDIFAGGPKDNSVKPDYIDNTVAYPNVYQLMANASDVRRYMESNIDAWAQAAVDNGGSASKDGLLLQYRTMIEGIFDLKWPTAEFFVIPGQSEMIIQAWNIMTFSRGSVHATAASTWVKSSIDPKYFSASIDMNMQVATMRGVRKTLQGQAFTNVLAQGETKPGFDANNGGIPQKRASSTFGRYDRWEKYIVDTFESVWHLVGTCAMMPEKLGGVVGPDFRVHQTANVFVIDASVIPIPLATHTTSVVYAMAGVAASVIAQS